jgi:hypothetical protein
VIDQQLEQLAEKKKQHERMLLVCEEAVAILQDYSERNARSPVYLDHVA